MNRTDRLMVFLTALAAVLLPGCVTNENTNGLPTLNGAFGPNSTHSRTFKYTGAQQTFKVPVGVRHITIIAHGGSGGGDTSASIPAGGRGAAVKATIAVKAGQILTIFVGGEAEGAVGGFNGGAGAPSSSGFGGGGSSDVRTGKGTLADRIIVAGGGGGAGDPGFLYDSYTEPCPGGAAGKGGGGAGKSGGCDSGGGGRGGHVGSGGAGGRGGADAGASLGGSSGCEGHDGKAGALLDGGAGATACGATGGSGGGGNYGGGGGGSGGCCGDPTGFGAGGGGGGGSSYVEKSATQVRQTTGGAPAGSGQIVISW